MKAATRSASGAVLMLAMIPAIVGVLACLPVPIGDPERSRIDPGITGVWAWLGGDEAAFYVFEPYDRRTWLLTGFGLENAKNSDYPLSGYADLRRLMESKDVGEGGATAGTVVLYKAWRTKIGGEWFMTWEPKVLVGKENFAPDEWMVFRIDRPDQDTLKLVMVDGALFSDVKKTRRAYERVIKKNVRNPDLYFDEPIKMVRVKPEHLDFVDSLANEVIKE